MTITRRELIWRAGLTGGYGAAFIAMRSMGLLAEPPAPAVPEDVVAATRARYVEVYERLTGQSWT